MEQRISNDEIWMMKPTKRMKFDNNNLKILIGIIW